MPFSTGALLKGDILISNFNDEENQQGTGTTLVELTPGGKLSVFAQISASSLPGPCPGGVGLTTALAILPGGYVVVGSLPTSNGKAATAKAGCLIVLNSSGHVVRTIAGAPINGPWDMTGGLVRPVHRAVRLERAQRHRRQRAKSRPTKAPSRGSACSRRPATRRRSSPSE